jgi:hypothetical protein
MKIEIEDIRKTINGSFFWNLSFTEKIEEAEVNNGS